MAAHDHAAAYDHSARKQSKAIALIGNACNSIELQAYLFYGASATKLMAIGAVDCELQASPATLVLNFDWKH